MITLRDRLELKYWLTADMAEHAAKVHQYLGIWAAAAGWPQEQAAVLEIGTGPTGGFLPIVNATRKVGIDPLHSTYVQLGLLAPADDVEYVSDYFDQWETTERFNAIMCADALDHGNMGFHLLPKISDLLVPGGRFYLHVHFRPLDHINLIHDHQLTIDQYNEHVAATGLVSLYTKLFPKDVDGKFCEAFVGVWEKQ